MQVKNRNVLLPYLPNSLQLPSEANVFSLSKVRCEPMAWQIQCNHVNVSTEVLHPDENKQSEPQRERDRD